jgi:hypothetical protein
VKTRDFAHPTDLGDVVLRAHYGDDGQPESVEVLEADPRVLIGGHLIREAHAGQPDERVPFATVDKPEVGGVLRIDASNRRLVYVLTEYEPLVNGFRARDAYTGEWPD